MQSQFALFTSTTFLTRRYPRSYLICIQTIPDTSSEGLFPRIPRAPWLGTQGDAHHHSPVRLSEVARSSSDISGLRLAQSQQISGEHQSFITLGSLPLRPYSSQSFNRGDSS